MNLPRERLHQILRENYVIPNQAGAFSGFESFFRSLVERGLVRRHQYKEAKEWAKGNGTYTKHYPARRRFKTNRVIVSGINDTWQLDLIDLQTYSEINENYNWILICIDVFSKFVWISLLKNKNAASVKNGLIDVLNRSTGRKPEKIQTDEGNEFENQVFKAFCRQRNIELFHVDSDKKASVVERVIRTIKEKMWRAFTDRGRYVYHDIIHDLIENYNNCYHRSIKTKPSLVTAVNEERIWEVLYGRIYTHIENRISFKYDVGEQVRYREFKDMRFDKGYVQNWSEEIFTIIERIPRVPPVYRIKEENGQELDSFYYEKELLAVNREPDPLYLIERIIRENLRNNTIFVKWLGYPDHYNSWISRDQVIQVGR